MLIKLIEISIRHRMIVIGIAAAIAVSGIISGFRLPLDAVPDLTNVQVQVVTSAGSLSPVEVERYITQPIELQLGGLPKMQELRSISRLGISLVTLVFEENTDLYWARQIVSQRLDGVGERLPPQVSPPQLGPLTTALGEVIQFEVRSDRHSPTQLRTMLEWDIAPRLRTVQGVTEVNTHGGFYRCFQVTPDPDRMLEMNLTIGDIALAIERNNIAVGGGYMIAGSQQRFIQGEAMLKSLDDIRQIVLRSADESKANSPILIENIADVSDGSLLRQGVATRDGRGEVVIGMAMMLIGENSRVVVQRVKDRLAEIEETLPKGVKLDVIYDRAGLIERALHTVGKNLIEGGTLVIIVLLVFLGSIRAGLVVAMAIPLSMLFASNAMLALGISASLMSLGAIDFGLIVDSSVIMIENCMHRLSQTTIHSQTQREEIIRDAAVEVRKPTLFGELIIAVVYLPLLMLEGSEGKLFRPMAITVLLALGGSLILSMTVMPALASLFLPHRPSSKESFLVRWIQYAYQPALRLVLRNPIQVMAIAVVLTLAAIPIARHLGAEFMPRLEEGDLLIEAVRLPSATLEDAIPMTTRIEQILANYSEIKTVFCKTGRPEIANDIMGVHQTDVWVMLHPKEEWPSGSNRENLIKRIEKELVDEIPGVAFGFTQPIEMRVDELVAGVKADVAVLVYGDDLKELARLGKEIAQVLRDIPGAADVKPDYQSNLTTLRVEVNHGALARYGLDASTVMQSVSAMGQLECSVAFVDRVRYPIMIRLPEKWRTDIERLKLLPIQTRKGESIPLKDVATIQFQDTPPAIEHQDNRRRTFVAANVRDRDMAGFVNEAQAAVTKSVPLPTGYEIRWGGDFENLQSASLRLAWITPLVMLLIAALLHATFHSTRLTTMVFLSVPVALSGGVVALALRGMPFSISAGVGFIALLGVAVLNSLVWVSAAEHRRKLGHKISDVVYETGNSRIRPILMTASVAALGFFPMAISHGDGAEIQKPLATVVIGGLITSTLLTTLVLPAVYEMFALSKGEKDDKFVDLKLDPHKMSHV